MTDRNEMITKCKQNHNNNKKKKKKIKLMKEDSENTMYIEILLKLIYKNNF